MQRTGYFVSLVCLALGLATGVAYADLQLLMRDLTGGSDGNPGSTTEAENILALSAPDATYAYTDYVVTSATINVAGGGNYSPTDTLPDGSSAKDRYCLQATAYLRIPAGDWTIGFGSDDGGSLTVSNITFINEYNTNGDPVSGDDEVRYNGTRGHAWTYGTFTLASQLDTELNAIMFESGGGDSFEIAIFNGHSATFNAGTWVLLSDGTNGWIVQTTPVNDTNAPIVSALSPTNGATGVYPGANLQVTFDEPVSLTNGGTVAVVNLDASTTNTITIPDAQLSVTDQTLTIDLTGNLGFATNYAVQISTNALTDTSTNFNFFAGITNNTTWTFTTVAYDASAPTLTGTTPVDEATEQAPTANLVAVFNENIVAGSGTITVTNISDSTHVTNIAVSDATQVSISTNVMTINPEGVLPGGVNLAVIMDSGVVKNYSEVDFAGISDTNIWNFSTRLPITVTWDGSTDMNWTEPDSTSWGGDIYIPRDTAQFLGSGSGTVVIDAGGVTPGAVVVNSSANYTFSGGSIGGTGSLTKAGTGTLTLSASNSYSGGTVLSGGLTRFKQDAHLGDPTGTLTLDGAILNYDTSGNAFSTRPLVLNSDNNEIQLQGNGHWYIGGAVTGTGGVKFQGKPNGGISGKCTNLNNTFTGELGLAASSGGGLTVELASLVDGPGYGNIYFMPASQSSTLTWRSDTTGPLVLDNRQIEFRGDGDTKATLYSQNASYGITVNKDLLVTGSGTKTLTLSSTSGQTNFFAGSITNGSDGTVAITKTGYGTWYLSGTNTYSGQTKINDNGRAIVFQNVSDSLPPASSIWIGGAASMTLLDDGSGTIDLGNDIDVGVAGTGERDGPTFFVGNNNTANGGYSSGTTEGSTIALGAVDLTYGDSRSTQKLTINGANGYRLQFGGLTIAKRADYGKPQLIPNSAPLTITGVVTMASGKLSTDSTNGDTLELAGSIASNIISASIQDAADYPSNPDAVPLNIRKSGSSEWTLSGVNTYSGLTTVDAGTLIIDGGFYSHCLPDTNSLTISGSGVLELNTGVKDRVGSLYFGAAQQVSGRWGSTSSVATNQNDTYFAGEGVLYVGVNLPAITNTPESDLTATSVTFNATLECEADEYDVYVFWGETDETNQASSWTSSAYVGSWTNVASTNISFWTNGLSIATRYYLTFCASNANETIWASPSFSFRTLEAPAVINSGATSDSETEATLNGTLVTGSVAQAWICWGTNDAGTASTGDWVNVVPVGTVTQDVEFSTQVIDLTTNGTYWYRCYATNIYGEDWSDDAEAFSGTPYSVRANQFIATNAGGIVTNYTLNGTNYEAHIFTGPGTLFVTSAGNAELLILAGGGQGGCTIGGGGGAGGLIYTNVYIDIGTNAVVVGDGGDAGGSWTQGEDGDNSSFGTNTDFVAIGGGGGGGWSASAGRTGGSGGGSANGNSTTASGTAGQGNSGGRASGAASGGGGGAAASGGSGTGSNCGDGGDGSQYDLSGEMTWFAGGGGGGAGNGATAYGMGGQGGGGAGSAKNSGLAGEDGVDGTGGGGGGGSYSAGTYGGFGGSGIVIVRSVIPTPTIANVAPTNIIERSAVLNASLRVVAGTNYAVYVHFGTSDGGTNFAWTGGYSLAETVTNSTATNETYTISYPKAGLKGGRAYWYTFRASNDAGNAWATPSWTFTTAAPTGVGSVFMFK